MYNLLKLMIEQKNYSTKEDLQHKMDVFYAVNRITEEQYLELTSLLKKEEIPAEPTV
ncbi:TPA: hypothetical protein KQB57_001389 [Clostridioides difficile]|uniref:hypothetical protein n=1 Tax=Clostridioides difficile TaxID=1496 RepID=UPI00016C5C56|nr:hypothetical protein [Clostridioides difficile]AXU86113.1 hypothetical protein CDIF29745_01275 [Clostridioides difficile]EJX2685870.1 hypothetical protein [Clostridioides difficile]EKG0814521.1 hypothetical protein [Clostridioides difficile]EKS6818731.1 hypothetical protein [Clostridioides difficile]EKS6820847.1 hypothetical protein [Clostridioides difficile]